MSGMVNPRPYIAPQRERETGPQKPDTMTNRLDRLSKSESGPVKVDEQGRIIDGGFGMKMRSGLNAFGFAKPTDDIKSNRETLNNVMQLLYDEARQTMVEQNKKWETEGHKNWHFNPDTYAQKVMDALYRSKTDLYGDSKFLGKTDPGYTIEQRIDRGTYLSGELAGQIKFRFDEIVRNSIEKTTGNLLIRDKKAEEARIAEANRRGENLEKFGPTNQDSVKRFLGQELENDGFLSTLVNTGAGIVDGIKGAFDKLTGTETRNTAFERTLLQIREQGTKFHPPSDTKFWDAFEDHWTRALTAPENSIEGMDLSFVQKKLEQYANNMARDGKIVDEKMLGEMLTKLTTNGMMLGRIGDLVNHEYVTKATIEDLSKAIEVWRDQQPDEVKQQISQNDCEWLAGEIHKSMEGERLMMERAPNFLTAFTDWSSNFTRFEEKYDKFGSSPVIARMYETMARNYDETDQPYFMPMLERSKHYLHKYDGDTKGQLKGWMEVALPPKWGPKELAGLIGDSIKDVLLDRHQRITNMMPELQDNEDSRKTLMDNLEHFPLLKAQGNKFFDHPEVLKNNPTKPSEFVQTIVSDPIIYARTKAEMYRQIKSGDWKSELPPEPPRPGKDAPKSEIEKYEVDKKRYDRLVGEEYGRFMMKSAQVREIARSVQESNIDKFQVLDEVQQTIEECGQIDLKSLRNDKEKMEEFGRKMDELRHKVGQMWQYSFGLINDSFRDMQITDDEAKAILGAVMGSWCDMDARLNALELEAGRAQFEIGQLLDTPKLESSNQTLRETDTNLRRSLEDSLKALESGDTKKMALTSDELMRQLVSAYDTAFEAFTARGSDEPQARQLLELIHKAARIGIELDRTPQLRERREGIAGWDDLVRNLLPSYLDLPSARGEPPPYETQRTQLEQTRRSETNIREYRENIEKRLGELPPEPPRPEPMEKPPWMTTGLHRGVSPFPTLQEYVSEVGIQGSRSVLELFERTVVRSVKDQMREEIENDGSIRQRDKTKVLAQQQAPFDKRWDEKIAPGLVALENFRPAPPLPEEINRRSVDAYRKTLTQYIDSMTKVRDLVRDTSMELFNVTGPSKGEVREELNKANKAIMPILSEIREQITVAQQRLQALS